PRRGGNPGRSARRLASRRAPLQIGGGRRFHPDPVLHGRGRRAPLRGAPARSGDRAAPAAPDRRPSDPFGALGPGDEGNAVEVAGCKLNLRRGGSGEPLLYLHGASGAAAVMPFMEKLASRFDVLVPEHPGFGLSEEPAWLENIHDLAYFYLDFLRALDLRGAHVVGS